MTNCDYRIGASAGALIRLPDLGVPDPEAAPFKRFSLRYTAGDGKIVEDGFAQVLWHWDTLARAPAQVLIDLLTSPVYIRTDNHSAVGQSFANYRAIPVLPDLSGDGGTPLPRNVEAYANFTIHFTHLIIV